MDYTLIAMIIALLSSGLMAAARPGYENSDRRAPGTVACNGAIFKSAKTKS